MKTKEKIALGVTLMIFGPLFFALCASFADGISRNQLAPLQSVVGQKVFQKWTNAEPTEKHYYGKERRVPDFELKDHRGEIWRVSDHRGKTLILNFWTITCAPCIEELPSLERLAKLTQEQDGDVEVIGICTDENWETVKHLFEGNPHMTVLFDPEKKVVHEKFGTELFPETWIVDSDGVIRFRYDGSLDWSSAVVRDLMNSF